jgi:hypothetical protein
MTVPDTEEIGLVSQLWQFIEEDGSTERFFELRAIVREQGAFHDNAPFLHEALKLAIKAMNNMPGFDTGIPDPGNPRRTIGSYKLLPQLEAILRGHDAAQSSLFPSPLPPASGDR